MKTLELEQNFAVQCPYCGELIDILVDTTAADQDFVEDCHVCCAPIVFRPEQQSDGAVARLFAFRENG